MLSVAQSQHVEMSSSGHHRDNRLAALVAVAILIATLMVAGCGQAATRVGGSGTRTTSGPTATVWPPPTPTDVAPPGAALTWIPGTVPPVYSLDGYGSMQADLDGLYVDPSDGST